MSEHNLRIRSMRTDEISIAVDWAAAEGWNPGLADAACFSRVDPDGFLIGELDGAPVATVSCVNYSASFAFLGLYIVRRDMRGRGRDCARNAGIACWSTRNRARWRGSTAAGYRRVSNAPTPMSVTAAPSPRRMRSGPVSLRWPKSHWFTGLTTRRCFQPAHCVLAAWISSPGHVARALVRARPLPRGRDPSVKGHKIGPLVADDATRRSRAGSFAASAERDTSMFRASTAMRSRWRKT